MINLKNIIKTILQIVFVINLIFFSTLQAKNYDKFNSADSISNYFSGIIHLNQNEYDKSYKYLKKINGLQKSNKNYSEKYLYSIVNTGNIFQALNIQKNLRKMEPHLLKVIYSKFTISNK